MSKALEDYKFVYKISCEPKISPNQEITAFTQKIIGIRVQMFDEMTKKMLKEIAEEKGYSEILVIDESKVDKFVKALKALEIIKSKGIDIDLLKYHKDLEHYNFSLRGRFEHLTQEEYELLKEVLNNG